MAVEIRAPKSEAEIKAAYSLVSALAAHEGASAGLKITEAGFIRAATGENPDIGILLAFAEGEPQGVCTYTERFHIWNGTRLIELDDLFVTTAARGKGLGTKLLKAVGAVAKARNIPVKWQVLPDNEGAIALYKRLGARYSTSGLCFWQPEDI